jgi:hypothetical protein
MLLKYRPEDKAAKKERLLKRAQAENEGKTVEAKKPIVVKYGLNHVTYLIEQACALEISVFFTRELYLKVVFGKYCLFTWIFFFFFVRTKPSWWS